MVPRTQSLTRNIFWRGRCDPKLTYATPVVTRCRVSAPNPCRHVDKLVSFVPRPRRKNDVPCTTTSSTTNASTVAVVGIPRPPFL
eukprot:2970142-Rhodomonas_salina.2